MSDLPIIAVTSIGDGFANAVSVPDDLPQWWKCETCVIRQPSGEPPSCRHTQTLDGPCPFDAVLEWQDVAVDFPHGVITSRLTKTITVLHHADECRVYYPEWREFDASQHMRLGAQYKLCHPDAMPDQYHIHFKENEA